MTRRRVRAPRRDQQRGDAAPLNPSGANGLRAPSRLLSQARDPLTCRDAAALAAHLCAPRRHGGFRSHSARAPGRRFESCRSAVTACFVFQLALEGWRHGRRTPPLTLVDWRRSVADTVYTIRARGPEDGAAAERAALRPADPTAARLRQSLNIAGCAGAGGRRDLLWNSRKPPVS